MHVQSYRFAYKTDWCFWRSCCRPRYWILKSRIIISSHRNLWFAPCKGIWIPESGNFFLWNPENFSCGIRQIFLVESEILRFGIRNTDQGMRNPPNDWTPESLPLTKNPESRIQCLEFRIHGVKSRIQDCLRNPRVRCFGMIRIRISDPRSLGPW